MCVGLFVGRWIVCPGACSAPPPSLRRSPHATPRNPPPCEQLDILCQQARCTILNQISNAHQDAYVLSESSLFVWPFKMMLKTCGTTTLLRCLPRLLEFTAALGMELEWVGYSRKNYSFPGDQCFPHSSFDQELAYLKVPS